MMKQMTVGRKALKGKGQKAMPEIQAEEEAEN
jgi:hypothetical protein